MMAHDALVRIAAAHGLLVRLVRAGDPPKSAVDRGVFKKTMARPKVRYRRSGQREALAACTAGVIGGLQASARMRQTEGTDGYAAASSRHLALHRHGFTIVELLVVLAIAAILVTIGVPSYQWTTSSFRISTETNALVGDLQYARSEAVKQGITVSMCISTDGATCSAATTSWAAGHIVISNPTGAAGTVLRVQGALSGTDTIVPSNGVASIAFNRDGFAGVPSATAWNGFSSLPAPVYLTVHDAANTASLGSCVLISQIGQISVLAKGTGGCS